MLAVVVAAAAKSVWDRDLIVILIFGVLTLGGLVAVYAINDQVSVNFARLYGFMAIVLLAVALAFVNIDATAKAAAYALLGTVAGYLAGAKPQAIPVGGANDDGDDDGGDDGDDGDDTGARAVPAKRARKRAASSSRAGRRNTELVL